MAYLKSYDCTAYLRQRRRWVASPSVMEFSTSPTAAPASAEVTSTSTCPTSAPAPGPSSSTRRRTERRRRRALMMPSLLYNNWAPLSVCDSDPMCVNKFICDRLLSENAKPQIPTLCPSISQLKCFEAPVRCQTLQY